MTASKGLLSSVGVATFVMALPPISMVAVAVAKPLRGILLLSNLKLVIALLFIVIVPELVKEASPFKSTGMALFSTLPTKILLLSNLMSKFARSTLEKALST